MRMNEDLAGAAGAQEAEDAHAEPDLPGIPRPKASAPHGRFPPAEYP